jgi:hypothetical protein
MAGDERHPDARLNVSVNCSMGCVRMNPKMWVSVLATLCLPSGSIADGFDDSQIRHIVYPDWFKENAFSDLPGVDYGLSGGASNTHCKLSAVG